MLKIIIIMKIVKINTAGRHFAIEREAASGQQQPRRRFAP
jgi:hypothetical protein